MFFDINKKKKRELERMIEHGMGDPARVRQRLAEIEQAGPVWVVDFYDNSGRRRQEKCPAEYQSEQGASRYHALCQERVKKGEYNPPDFRRAKVSEMIRVYLDYKRKKAEKAGKHRGFTTAKYLCGKIDELIGDWRIDRMDADPEMVTDFFYDFPRKDWSPKTIWNFFVTFKAMINHWIKFKRLIMKNPCDLVELDPQTRILDYVPTHEDFEKIITASFVVGLPDWVRNLLVAVYESGLRINEVMGWRVEDLDLCEPVFGKNRELIKVPSFMVTISKQRRMTRKRIPMSFTLWQMIKAQTAGRNEGLVFGCTKPPYRMLKWLRCPSCGERFFDNRRPYRRAGEQCPKCNKAALQSWGISHEAGVPYFRPFHDYRKSVKHANRIERGLPAAVSMAFQGHASESMEKWYLHIGAHDLIPAVADSWKGYGDPMETRSAESGAKV